MVERLNGKYVCATITINSKIGKHLHPVLLPLLGEDVIDVCVDDRKGTKKRKETWAYPSLNPFHNPIEKKL